MRLGIVAAATSLTLLASSAFAQENDRGFYIGGGFGAFDVKVDDIDDTDEAISRIDDDDNSWKIFAGWRLNRYVAFELNYIDFGETTGTTASGSSGDYAVEISGVQPAVYGTLPLGPIELFAKLGYYFYDVDLRFDFDDLDSENFRADTSEEAWSYGAGVGITLLERLNVKLEYEKIDTDVIDDLDAIWASAAWRF
ncbi:MAG TPA: porin family protein [Steroidobacteraceae bacterium]